MTNRNRLQNLSSAVLGCLVEGGLLVLTLALFHAYPIIPLLAFALIIGVLILGAIETMKS